VLKALALGARAVGVGKPFFWGLAVNGADGVHAVLELLRHELDVALAFCGKTSVAALEPDLVNRPPGWGR
jgi:isopentenyl diphosphate isomerase/L-lactate dehydrogenase-like FMN-dependent dehydrogenase